MNQALPRTKTPREGTKPWGISATIDLYGCRHDRLTSGELLREFVRQLIAVIDMEAHGPCHLDRFGVGALEGYSAMQFIKTSTITVHLDEVDDRVFIDIFSCKDFDVHRAKRFAAEFFDAASFSVSQQDR